MISEPYLGKEECCKASLFSSFVLQHLPFWTFHHHHMFWSILTNRSLELKKKYGRCQNNGHVFEKKVESHKVNMAHVWTRDSKSYINLHMV